MKNPFLTGEYLRLEASLNKVMLLNTEKLTNDTEIEGKSAFEVFSAEAIIQEIKHHSDALQLSLAEIPEKELPIHLSQCLESQTMEVRNTAQEITAKFGKRLGVILSILRRGKSNHILERKDWNDEDWHYWQTIENIVLTGGLSNGKMGIVFKQSIQRLFEEAGIKPFNVFLTKNPTTAGLSGASMYIKERNGANLIFDFGQSFLKRCIAVFSENVLMELKPLETRKARYMEWNPDLTIRYEAESKALDAYLQETILESLHEAENNKIATGSEISISIANYIINGKFLNRGGYGKLGLLCDNYEKHLSNDIRKKTGKKYTIKIIHDGTAIASNFMKLKNAASISLGTAFGIGFPGKNKYGKKISEELSILERMVPEGKPFPKVVLPGDSIPPPPKTAAG